MNKKVPSKKRHHRDCKSKHDPIPVFVIGMFFMHMPYGNWIMLALIRHPDFIQQCIDLSLFDEKIKNYYDLDQVKNNALQLKLYQENKMQLNTCHSKFHTSIIDVHTIDEYIYPTSQIENNDRELYLKNSQFNYQNN